jgi:hypothetical protein
VPVQGGGVAGRRIDYTSNRLEIYEKFHAQNIPAVHGERTSKLPYFLMRSLQLGDNIDVTGILGTIF